jgi:archaemetzincin
MKIAIVLVERTVPGMRELMDAVHKEFGAHVIRDTINLGVTRALRAERNQYDAQILLTELSRFKPATEKTLFIFREDLFVENLNFVFPLEIPANFQTRQNSWSFVFGLAKGDTAIISTTRLDPRFYGDVEDLGSAKTQFIERLIKESLHELGHTFGLPHCENKKCVMVFSNSIEEVDAKGSKFCDECAKAIYRKE